MVDFNYKHDRVIYVMAKAGCDPFQIARRCVLTNFTHDLHTGEPGISWDVSSVIERSEWLLENFKSLAQLKHYYDYSIGGETL